MASSQRVDDIRHWFAVFIFIPLSIDAVKFWTGVTRGISIRAVMPDDHDVQSGTFLQNQYLFVSKFEYSFAAQYGQIDDVHTMQWDNEIIRRTIWAANWALWRRYKMCGLGDVAKTWRWYLLGNWMGCSSSTKSQGFWNNGVCVVSWPFPIGNAMECGEKTMMVVMFRFFPH